MRDALVPLQTDLVPRGRQPEGVRLALVAQGIRLGGADVRLAQPGPVRRAVQRVGPPVGHEAHALLAPVPREAVVAKVLDGGPGQDGPAEELVKGGVRRVGVKIVKEGLRRAGDRGEADAQGDALVA